MVEDEIVFIVPYRDRAAHLSRFLAECQTRFQHKRVRVIVVEQADTKPFNRGRLLNLGFRVAAASSDWVCFHDVDLIPAGSDDVYFKPAGAAHLAGRAGQYGYRMPYDGYVGGALAITTEAFSSVDGFPSEYWGWGREDDDFLLRLWSNNIPIEYRGGVFLSLPHIRSEAPNQNNALFFQQLSRYESQMVDPTHRQWIARKLHYLKTMGQACDSVPHLSPAGGLSFTNGTLLDHYSLNNALLDGHTYEVYSYDLTPSTSRGGSMPNASATTSQGGNLSG